MAENLAISCPKCQARLKIPAAAASKRAVRCPRCSATVPLKAPPTKKATPPVEEEVFDDFEVVDEEPPKRTSRTSHKDEEDERPLPTARSSRETEDDEEPASRRKRRSVEEDDEEDDRPRARRRSSRDDDEEDDDRPSSRRRPSRDDDEEEEDERPRSRRRPSRYEDEDEEEDDRPRRRNSRRKQTADEGPWLLAALLTGGAFFVTFAGALVILGTAGLKADADGPAAKLGGLGFGFLVSLILMPLGIISVKNRKAYGRWGFEVRGGLGVALGMIQAIGGGLFGGFALYGLIFTLINGR